MQWLHNTSDMPTIHHIGSATIRVNTPDHRPPHEHVVLSDRRDALVYLDTLQVVSRTVRVAEIAEALRWIQANQDVAGAIFEECNP